MKNSIILLALMLVFGSCDVPGHLVLVNKTKQDVVLDLSTFPSGLIDQEMSKIDLPKKGPRVHFTYGFGGFPPEWLDSLRTCFKEVKIINGSDTIVINDQESLDAMLPEKIRGFMNSRMKIRIKYAP